MSKEIVEILDGLLNNIDKLGEIAPSMPPCFWNDIRENIEKAKTLKVKLQSEPTEAEIYKMMFIIGNRIFGGVEFREGVKTQTEGTQGHYVIKLMRAAAKAAIMAERELDYYGK